MTNLINKGIINIVDVCMGIKRGDRVSIIFEDDTKLLSKKISEYIKGKDAQIVEINIDKFGSRPVNESTAKKLIYSVGKTDISLICIKYFHQEFETLLLPLANLTSISNMKMAFLFDLNERLLVEGMNANYLEIKKLNNKLMKILSKAKIVKVTTKLGTDITVDLGYKFVSLDGFPRKGKWVNLPDGEVFTTPVNINGTVAIDGVVEEFDKPKFGILKKYPIKMMIKNNRVVLDTIETRNKELRKFIIKNLSVDRNSNRIGEFALGTNVFLKSLIGNLTQDEKFPSVHIAWGNPHGSTTGAKWTSKQHQDAVILKTTVEVDGRIIMNEGKYCL